MVYYQPAAPRASGWPPAAYHGLTWWRATKLYFLSRPSSFWIFWARFIRNVVVVGSIPAELIGDLFPPDYPVDIPSEIVTLVIVCMLAKMLYSGIAECKNLPLTNFDAYANRMARAQLVSQCKTW